MPITVPYKVLHEGREEAVDNQKGITATMRFLIDWTDRWQFARDVAGTAQAVGTGNGSIIRTVPLQYPDNNYMYATGLSFSPVGQSYCSGDLSYYEKAIATVTFSTPQFDYENTQGQYSKVYKTLAIEMSAQYMTIPGSPFKMATQYGGQDVIPQINPGIVIPQATINLTAHQLADVPIETIFPLIGTLNNAIFYGCAIGTLMFLGANCQRTPTSEGFMAWEVAYQFMFRPVDWNKFWSPARGIGWDFLVDRLTGNKVYAYSDFNSIP